MRRPIRVLHIIKNLGLGGAETNLLHLAQAFDPDRIETHVAYSRGGEIEPRFRTAHVRLFRYAAQDHRVKSLQTALIVLRLVRYIRRQQIDIVHSHNFSGHVWGMMAVKLTGRPLVEHVHDFRYTPSAVLARGHGLLDQYRYVHHFRGRSDRVVVLTEAHRQHVIDERFAKAARVLKVPNGIDFGTLASSSVPRLPTLEEPIVVLTAARIDPTKNIDLILRVANAVRRSAPTMTFVIAGSGAYLEDYRAQSHALGLDEHVRFVGFQENIDALLATADVFLLPSWLELHSIAILEAMRRRVPVVVSRGVGCNDEFIEDGVNGFLCDPGADAPWIDVLGRLCASPELRASVGEQGHATARRLFDIETTASCFMQIYADLLERPHV